MCHEKVAKTNTTGKELKILINGDDVPIFTPNKLDIKSPVPLPRVSGNECEMSTPIAASIRIKLRLLTWPFDRKERRMFIYLAIPNL